MTSPSQLEELHGISIEGGDEESGENLSTESPMGEMDVIMSAEGGVGAPKKLSTGHNKPKNISQFNPALANMFASEKKWDYLKSYLGRFGGSGAFQFQFLVDLELNVIKLIEDDNYVNAALYFDDVITTAVNNFKPIDTVQNLSAHLLKLEQEVKSSIFDEHIAMGFINNNNLDGLNDYVKVFMANTRLGADHVHPGLQLALHGLHLAAAAEREDEISAMNIFNDNIKPLRAVTQDSKFRPMYLIDQIQMIESALSSSLKIFDAHFKQRKVNTVFDYMRLYFRERVKPLLEADGSISQFAYKECDGRSRCMACGTVFPARKGLAWFEEHVMRTGKNKTSKCDGWSPYLGELLSSYKAQALLAAGSSRGGSTVAPSSSKSTDSTPKTRKRKCTNDGSQTDSLKGAEAVSAVNEIPVDDPVSVLGSLLASHSDFSRIVSKDVVSVSSMISTLLKDQVDIIFKLYSVISLATMDVLAVLNVLADLEKKNVELFPLIMVLPLAVRNKYLEFVGLSFRMRSCCMKQYGESEEAVSDVCDLGGKLMSVHFQVDMMIQGSSVGSDLRDEIMKHVETQSAKILEMLKIVTGKKVNAEYLVDVVLSLSSINDGFLGWAQVLPKGLFPKLAESCVFVYKLWCLGKKRCSGE